MAQLSLNVGTSCYDSSTNKELWNFREYKETALIADEIASYELTSLK